MKPPPTEKLELILALNSGSSIEGLRFEISNCSPFRGVSVSSDSDMQKANDCSAACAIELWRL